MFRRRIVYAAKITWLLNMCCSSAQIEEKKKENITKSENHEYKTTAQRTQSGHDRCAHDINNRFAELISNDEIIEKEEDFSLIKFSNEEFLSTWQ